jgi:Calx-beta domain
MDHAAFGLECTYCIRSLGVPELSGTMRRQGRGRGDKEAGMGRFLRRAVSVAAAVGLVGGVVVAASSVAQADTVSSNFEGLTLGTVNGQDGWVNTGGGGLPYDQYVVDNSLYANAPASFGTQSLRISNAVTSGSFGDHAFSRKTVNEAGEPTADAGAYASGVRQPSYTGEFSFAPTTTAPQPGLSVVASPDRGDGARMSWVQIADTGGPGLDLNFSDYVDVAPLGTNANHANGCDSPSDDFHTTNIATGITRSVAHTVKIVMWFLPGQGNDVVKVYLDGVLKHTGTSWEDYFRWCDESTPSETSRTVRSLLFRTGGTAVPAVAGQGLLIDDVSSTTGPILPIPVVNIGNASVPEGNAGYTTANLPVTLSDPYPLPVQVHYATANGTATTINNIDYPAQSGTLTIPANTTAATLPIYLYGGNFPEPDETFTVTLTNPVNASLGTAVGTVTILNDDVCPAAFTIFSENLPAAHLGTPYAGSLYAGCATAPIRWKKIGKLPKGLKLRTSTSEIFGVPKKLTGTFTFTMQARYKTKVKHHPAVKHVATRQFSITVT